MRRGVRRRGRRPLVGAMLCGVRRCRSDRGRRLAFRDPTVRRRDGDARVFRYETFLSRRAAGRSLDRNKRRSDNRFGR